MRRLITSRAGAEGLGARGLGRPRRRRAARAGRHLRPQAERRGPGASSSTRTRTIVVDTAPPRPAEMAVESATLGRPGPGECRVTFTSEDPGSLVIEALRDGRRGAAAAPRAATGAPRTRRCAGAGTAARADGGIAPPGLYEIRAVALRRRPQPDRARAPPAGSATSPAARCRPPWRRATGSGRPCARTGGARLDSSAVVTLALYRRTGTPGTTLGDPLGAQVGGGARGPAGARAGADPAGHQPRRALAGGPHRRRARRGTGPPGELAVNEAAREVAAVRGRVRRPGAAAAPAAPSQRGPARRRRWPSCWPPGQSCSRTLVPEDDARDGLDRLASPLAAGGAAVGVIVAVVVLVVGVRIILARPTVWFVLAGDRAAHPHPGDVRQPGGQPPGPALRRDPARPGRVRLGPDPRPHPDPRARGPRGAERAARRPRGALPRLHALERRPRGGRGEGRLLLPALRRALRCWCWRGGRAPGRWRRSPSPPSPGA